MTICMAVDPGLTGAIAWVDSSGACQVHDIPTVDLPGNGMVTRRIDGLALAKLVRHQCPAPESVLSICEHVMAMGGKNNSLQTQGSLMRSLGAIEAVLEVLRMPPKLVAPQSWKKFYGLGSDKKESLRVARELYPSAASSLSRVRDHNRAEAVLIAHFGLRTLA